MKKTIVSLVSATLILSAPHAFAASSQSKPRVATTKTIVGSVDAVMVSGDVVNTGPLWSAKFPLRMNHASDGVDIQFKSLVDYQTISNYRISFGLWTKGGKKIDSQVFIGDDWNPNGTTTIYTYKFYRYENLRPGTYIMVITSSQYGYEGTGVIKLPVTLY